MELLQVMRRWNFWEAAEAMQLVRSSATVTDRPRLIRTAEAARELAIDPSTLSRWAQAGIVTPAHRTAGGQARWNLDDLRRQIAEHEEKQRREREAGRN